MKDKIHGILSIIFALSSFILANVKLYEVSAALGIVYSVLLFIAILITLTVFCPKCPHLEGGNSCRHLFVGWMVLKLFKMKVKPGPYTQAEKLATNIPLLLAILGPQYWLFQDWRFLAAFWALTAVYFFEIKFRVCPGCRNVYCDAYPNKKAKKSEANGVNHGEK